MGRRQADDVVATVTGTNDAPEVISADGGGTVSELSDGDRNEKDRILSGHGTIVFEDVYPSDRTRCVVG